MLLNTAQRRPIFKFAVYGRGGVGKTRLGCTAPRPLFILTERQGFETVRAASAQLGIPMPPVFWVRNIGQVAAIAEHLKSRGPKTIEAIVRDTRVISDEELNAYGVTRDELVDAIPYAHPETIVIDMLGEIAEWIGEEIDLSGGMEVQKGIETRKVQAWTPIQKRVTRFIRSFRDMPYHVLFLCHDRIVGGRGDDDLAGAEIWPKLPGRELHKVLAQSVNAMGRMRILERDVEIEGKMVVQKRRAVEFVTSDAIWTKHADPLRERERPNVSKWIEALTNENAIAGDQEELALSESETKPESGAESKAEGGKKKRSRKQEEQQQ